MYYKIIIKSIVGTRIHAFKILKIRIGVQFKIFILLNEYFI